MTGTRLALSFAAAGVFMACSSDDTSNPGGSTAPLDPDQADVVSVDRFSAAAGTLQVRDADNGLPGPDQPVDFDEPPFITRGFGPEGQVVEYYNFDVRPTTPAPIYALFREDTGAPVVGQLNIVDVLPGDPGYNDFWQVTKVEVPADYVANSITSLSQLERSGYPIDATPMLVNCPVVPAGSTASMRGGTESKQLQRGWYRGQVVNYFSFEEAPLTVTSDESVPAVTIFVTFNINPNEAGGGPPSGFVHEPSSEQTHNVPSVLPDSPGYSPLWAVTVYDNAAFDEVMDLETASRATLLAEEVANVNCPIVSVSPAP
jgi:hypothetical protein